MDNQSKNIRVATTITPTTNRAPRSDDGGAR
jgi:hypothetical protein